MMKTVFIALCIHYLKGIFDTKKHKSKTGMVYICNVSGQLNPKH